MSHALEEIWRYRYFWMSLVQADLSQQYRGSVLGMLWGLLQPIVMTVVLCVVFSTLFNLDIRVYGPFLLVGFTFWRYFTSMLVAGAYCLQSAEPFLRQHPAPVAIYPLRHSLTHGFHFLLAFGMAILATCVLNGPPGWQAWPALLSGLVILFLFGWALATVSGFMNIYMPDGAHFLEISTQVLFYATPIIYPPELLRARGMGWFIDMNPIAAMIDLLRVPLMTGAPASLFSYAMALGTLSIVMLMAMGLLVRLERRILYVM